MSQAISLPTSPPVTRVLRGASPIIARMGFPCP
jgi:hypothetical protein